MKLGDVFNSKRTFIQGEPADNIVSASHIGKSDGTIIKLQVTSHDGASKTQTVYVLQGTTTEGQEEELFYEKSFNILAEAEYTHNVLAAHHESDTTALIPETLR